MPRRFCIHCNGPVTPPSEVCESCVELLSDLGEEDEPQPRPAPVVAHKPGPFEPSQADVQAYSVMSERGAFRPFDQVRPKQLPSHARNRWGKAISNWKDVGGPDVPKK